MNYPKPIGFLFAALLSAGALAAPVVAEPQVSSRAIQATRMALSGNFMEAGPLADITRDEAAIKLIELFYLRDHPKEAGYSRIMDFLAAAPKWPLADALLKRAERTLYSNNEPTPLIMNHFLNRSPVTAEGALALARARLASGDRPGAVKMLQLAWNNAEIEPELEKAITQEFKPQLGAGDYKSRMWRLIFAQETNAAIRASKRLDKDHQRAANVAQELIRGVRGADKQYARLSPAMRSQVGMKYALVRYYRKLDKLEKAREVLAGIPGDAEAMGDAAAWLAERRGVARGTMARKYRGGAATAYDIARKHGLKAGDGAIEGEFLAGWLALRQLKQPEKALAHFTKQTVLSTTHTEKARANYWLGRSYAELGKSAMARDAYQEAAQYSTVYYGQLAREEIGLGKVPETINKGDASAAARAKVDNDEVMRAFKLIAEAGDKRDLPMFLWALAARFKTVDEMNAVAAIVARHGGTTMALRLAKAAAQFNVDIDTWAYPVNALPAWQPMGRPVEKALVYALSRQESEFDAKAGSTAGAQGLMQIMPATAKLIAKRYKLPYKTGVLTANPAYNVRMGAAHLGDLVDDFGGSYVLTLVAYNAGPRRSSEWVTAYGDLRASGVDPIDWVESIPFPETRQYVQKVLQNVHVYRSRLDPKSVRPMTADLSRGGRAFKVAATSGKGQPRTATCDGGSIVDLISTCK